MILIKFVVKVSSIHRWLLWLLCYNIFDDIVRYAMIYMNHKSQGCIQKVGGGVTHLQGAFLRAKKGDSVHSNGAFCKKFAKMGGVPLTAPTFMRRRYG